MLIVESQSLDVYRNLAIEEYLMDQVVDRGPVLFLWRSDCAVVMGKNQNPWRECRLDLMRDEGVPLARRISGGGTVYHDAGNLNYSVIVDRTKYREDQAYEMVLQALKTFGVDAEKTGKSNLSVDGRKFSGNAFCFRKGRVLHHGTLLLDTRLERLDRYLGSMFDQIETRAIASVPAEVMNLGLGVEELSLALVEGFRSLYGDGELYYWSEAELKEAVFRPLLDRQISSDWHYGATPRFTVEQSGLRLEVVKGVVVQAEGQYAEWQGKPFKDAALSLIHQID
jgi:lipoate-protein ligase A